MIIAVVAIGCLKSDRRWQYSTTTFVFRRLALRISPFAIHPLLFCLRFVLSHPPQQMRHSSLSYVFSFLSHSSSVLPLPLAFRSQFSRVFTVDLELRFFCI